MRPDKDLMTELNENYPTWAAANPELIMMLHEREMASIARGEFLGINPLHHPWWRVQIAKAAMMMRRMMMRRMVHGHWAPF
jgi:hypothetical protein